MGNGRTIALAGSLAQRPGVGGHTWVFLQYLLGFRRLGWNVLFLDELQPEMCVDDAGAPCLVDRSRNLRYFLEVLERFGLNGSFALLCDRGRRVVGMERNEVLERVRRSALLLNVMGFLSDAEVLAAAKRRVFLDIDPGFGQIWRALDLADVFRGHDDFVTIGENIGRRDCDIPTCGLNWITTPQPVVLECWPPQSGAGGAITSVARWRGPYGTLTYQGKTYGLRVHEFRRFTALPRLSGQPFELALDIDPSEVKDLQLLAANGWSRVDPRQVAGDPWRYRSYIQESRAEWMVAKNLYVQTNSGWFSDRSLCYLASGRPVLAQDTGWTRLYPAGEGLMAFTTPEEALAGVETIGRDYARHARAARAVAEEHFDSDKVLSRLLGKLGVA